MAAGVLGTIGRSGPSTGTRRTVALHLARELGFGKRVVTLVDCGLEYLGSDLYS